MSTIQWAPRKHKPGDEIRVGGRLLAVLEPGLDEEKHAHYLSLLFDTGKGETVTRMGLRSSANARLMGLARAAEYVNDVLEVGQSPER